MRWRGTSLIRKHLPLGPNSWPIQEPMVVLGSGRFLMSEVPLSPEHPAPAGGAAVSRTVAYRATSLTQENAPPSEPTVGLCLGP